MEPHLFIPLAALDDLLYRQWAALKFNCRFSNQQVGPLFDQRQIMFELDRNVLVMEKRGQLRFAQQVKERFRFTALRAGQLLKMGKMGDFYHADFQDDRGFASRTLKCTAPSQFNQLLPGVVSLQRKDMAVIKCRKYMNHSPLIQFTWKAHRPQYRNAGGF